MIAEPRPAEALADGARTRTREDLGQETSSLTASGFEPVPIGETHPTGVRITEAAPRP